MSRKINFLRGDTLVEVMFAVGIFGIVAVSAISLMNRGVNTAQAALETTMARNEIDAQAEALRFIHDAYAAEFKSENKEYGDLWNDITSLALNADDIKDGSTSYPKFKDYPSAITSCISEGEADYSAAYTHGVGIIKDKSFIINTHALNASAGSLDSKNILFKFGIDDPSDSNQKVHHASTYPRLGFKNNANSATTDSSNLGDNSYLETLSFAEGIWVTGVKSAATSSVNPNQPQYYDFYIRTCWNSPGQKSPITISTTIRLYNPDI